MKKFLFLDIDGVMNGFLRDDKEMHYLCDLCPILVERVKRIISATQCEVILSTSWRYDEYIDKIMEHCGIQYSDKTDLSWCRGQEIKNWLSEQTDTYTYCVLEDSEEMLEEQEEHIVWTDFNYGISESQVEIAINILNDVQEKEVQRQD